MARVTVEDCIDKVDSPYQLVLVAKERVTQLNSGAEPNLPKDNDKNTVISLREIAEGKISIKTLEDSAINKLKRNNISIKSEIISIKDSLNRVLAKDVISPANYPICDNTAFDGYALNSQETKSLNVKKSKKFNNYL